MNLQKINNEINKITSTLYEVGETHFIETTADIENYLVSTNFIKVFYHLNPSTFIVNNDNGSFNSNINYRIIVSDLLTDNNENYESSISNTQSILEEILYKLFQNKNIQINNNNYILQPFINEFSVKLCGWYVDISIIKDLTITCGTTIPIKTVFIDDGIHINKVYYQGDFINDTILYLDPTLQTIVVNNTYLIQITNTITSIIQTTTEVISYVFEITDDDGKIKNLQPN